MEERAQVHVEELLMIVGTIIVVTVVALYIKNAANSAAQAVNNQSKN